MSPSPDLELTLAAVWEAGQATMAWFRSDPDVRLKGPDQPVTEADLTADRILAERLLGARPDDGWLSEETADTPDRLTRTRVWIVDPVDGTRSFIAGYREFAVSVALVEAGEAVLGVVYNPALEDVFWAVRGGGAYRVRPWHGDERTGERLRVVDPSVAETPSLLASRAEIRRGEFQPFGAWELRPLGSTAYKLGAMAAGAGHAFLSRGPKSEWDVAAGALIVEEAGGVVTDLRGDRLRYNRRDPRVYGILAATPALHGRLLARVSELDSPRLDRRDGPAERAG